MSLKYLSIFLTVTIVFSMDIYSGGKLSLIQNNMDVHYYDIHLTVDSEKKIIHGYVELGINVKDTTIKGLELDLIDQFDISKIKVNALMSSFSHNNNKITISPTSLVRSNTIRIYYSGKPPEANNPPWDGGFSWESDSLGYPWIGVSCQTNGAHIWIPCIEHPSDEADSVDLFITTSKHLVVAGNGLLIDTTADNNQTTWHWKTTYPISAYNINFTIGKFQLIEKDLNLKNPTHLQYFVLQEYLEGSGYIINEAEKYLKFYESLFGAYPWSNEKFGMVQTPYWGMEHQTIIAYGNNYKIRKPGYDFLLLHEMGHEWWGNYLTVHDWADFWIHEGITIYAEALFIEENFGIDAYHEFFKKTVRSKISNNIPIVPKQNAISQDVKGLDVYYKGAMVLHMLRYLIGKEKLISILNTTLHSEKSLSHNHVSTQDFIDITNEITSEDFGWFFDVYLKKKDPPKLVIKNRWKTKTINWENPNFLMPIEIETFNGEIVKIQPGKRKIKNVKRVDPTQWILFN